MSKTDRPTVSVIMPLYNKRGYVKRSIESVQKQTFHNWELIIIDDGSTDGSSSEIPKSDGRIKLYQQKNAGPGVTRNKAFQKARGSLISFIDADDYYYPTKLEQEVEFLLHEQKADWMFSIGNFEINNKIKTGSIYTAKNETISGPPTVIHNAISQLVISGWPVDGLCIRKSLMNKFKGFREDMPSYEITEFIFRCALVQPKVLICPVALYSVVDVPQSAYEKSSNRIEGMRLLSKSLISLSKEYPKYSERLLYISRSVTLDYLGSLILTGSAQKARRLLIKNFPFEKNLKWWKLVFASYLPDFFLSKMPQGLLFREYEKENEVETRYNCAS